MKYAFDVIILDSRDLQDILKTLNKWGEGGWTPIMELSVNATVKDERKSGWAVIENKQMQVLLIRKEIP